MSKKIILMAGIIFCFYYFRDIIRERIFILIHKNKIAKNITEPAYYLINVLDAKDFEDAHIKGSIHIPFAKVNEFLNSVQNKNIPLIFYCSNYFCTASDAAAKIAYKKGFKTVFVYKGGMAEWYQASKEDNIFEYEGPAKAEYLKIVILPQEEMLDPDLDIIDEDNHEKDYFKIISINNLQNFLKEGIIIK